MLIGYARVSKADGSQSLDLQRDALRAEGIDGKAYGSSGKWGGGDVVGTFRIPNLLPVRLSI